MTYTQAPPLTDEEIKALLKEAPIARICSFNQDGTIHAAPVWFKYENGCIVLTTPKASRKARNIKRNKHVTVLIDIEGPSTKGVIIYGKAELENLEIDDLPWTTSLLEKYMPNEQARALAQGLYKIYKPVKISIKPEHIASFDYTKDDTYRAACKG